MIVVIAGALVVAVLISRLIWLVTKRWPDSIGKAVLINAVSAMIAMAAAYGFANGESPRFDIAFLICGGAQLIVLTFDVVGLVKPSTKAQ